MALISTRRRGFSTNLAPTVGSVLSQGQLPTITGTSGGADSYGITTYALQTLITGLNNGAILNDNTSGAATGAWTSDGTGSFYRMTYPAAGGNAGPYWSGIDSSKRQIYVRWDYRRNSNNHTKRMKIFGKGYPTNYSNFNVHVDYSGTPLGISYSDKTGGGDIDVQFFIGSYPTLTGGSAFSRSPHPVEQVDIATNEHTNSTWDTHEFFGLHNDDGTPNGEIAYWYNGTLILWLTAMYNCRTGGQGFAAVTLCDYANNPGSTLIEDVRNWYVSYDRPTGRGI
jgi:hypothetical protein